MKLSSICGDVVDIDLYKNLEGKFSLVQENIYFDNNFYVFNFQYWIRGGRPSILCNNRFEFL